LSEKNKKEETKLRALNPQPIQSFPVPCYIEKTGGLLHRQTLALNLLRRCRQTGLDAKGVTPELLRMKFYCSQIWNFFFSLFVCSAHSLFVHHQSLLISLFLLFFAFFSFFLGFVSFTIVS
jgi:hypothetical protein